MGGSFLHVHVHRCSGEIHVQVVCAHARRVHLFWGWRVRECKGEKGKNKICRVDGEDVTNTQRLEAGEVSVSPLAQTWRAIRGRGSEIWG